MRKIDLFGKIIGIYFIICTVLALGACIEERVAAEPQAKKWAEQMGLTVVGVSCADRDTDNDGYVSCTVSAKDAKGEIQLHAIECASRLSFNDGCRAPKFKVSKSN